MKIKLLREARKICNTWPIERHWFGICDAIGEAFFSDPISKTPSYLNDYKYLIKWIRSQLNFNAYLTEWLEENNIDWEQDLPRLRATRLAWIDWMIKELKRTGETE